MPESRRRARESLRRLFAAGVVALAAAACSASTPAHHDNALVLHVVTADCEHGAGVDQIAMLHQTHSGAFGLRTADEAARFERVDGCGEPITGRGHLQVWRTDYDWSPDQHIAIAVAGRVDPESVFVSPADGRLRIDHAHVLVGVLDISGDEPTLGAPIDDAHIAGLLQDRQECDRKTVWWSCGTEWESADLLCAAQARSFRCGIAARCWWGFAGFGCIA